MKRLLLLLLLAPLFTFSQRQYKQALIGEYANYFIDTAGKAFTYDNNVLVQYNLPERVDTGSAGHPRACVISRKTGNAYQLLGDSREWKQYPVSNALNSSGYFNMEAIVTNDGQIMLFNDAMQFCYLYQPAGVRYKSVATGHYLQALDYSGTVWEFAWSKEKKVIYPIADLVKLIPTKKSLPGPATQVVASRSYFNAALVNGEPYVWTETYGVPYMGLTTATSTPVNTFTLWGLTEKLQKIVASDNVMHMLTVTGKLYGIGDRSVGEVGDGKIADGILKYGIWDFKYRTFTGKAVWIRQDITFANIFGGNYYAYRHAAQDMLGFLYFWGYGKFGLLSTGIKPFDDPKNVSYTCISIPWRVSVPRQLVVVSSVEAKNMVTAGTYPPFEPIRIKTLISTQYVVDTIKIIKTYDDGSVETMTTGFGKRAAFGGTTIQFYTNSKN